MRLRGPGGDRSLRGENCTVGSAASAGPAFKRSERAGSRRRVASIILHLRVSADFSHCSAARQSG